MSLVGSLEDLGLGDILQIIHLSGKSGALVLKSDHGEAEIVFDSGLIRAAILVGGPATLPELLIAREAAPADAIREAAGDARTRGCALGQVLADRNLVDAETIDGLQRDHIEAATLEMFRWPAGEFSFEVREVRQDEDEFYATPGVNPQFIALEGTRMADENAFGADASDADPMEASDPIDGAHIVAESVVEAEVPSDAFAPLSPLSETDLRAPDLVSELDPEEASDEIATAVAIEGDDEILEAIPLAVDSLDDAAPEPEPVIAPAPAAIIEPAPPELPPSVPTAPVAPLPRPAVVVIDPDLRVLEWAKDAMGDNFPQVHIFQRTDLAIARIRQYLARTQVPLVVLASDVPRDPISGADGPFELLRRLRRQSARMPVAILAHEGRDLATPTDARPSVVVRKPNPSELADPRRGPEREQLGTALVEELVAVASGAGPTPSTEGEAAPEETPTDFARLRETSARIREGAAHGDVLPQVLAFAAQTFARVALFMIRDDQALGIAQIGLSRAGGPDEEGLREIHIDAREPAWFRAVLDQRAPHRGAPSDDGDQRLAVMLGNEIPGEAYLAPIQTADHVVAILYGDNLPSRAAIPETSGLEVVIDSAGIALERTQLERELAATQD
jgi:hypothetical protein